MDTLLPDNAERIDDILKKIERTKQARRHKFYLRDEKITLSHGSGGKSTHNLIEGVIAPAFSNPMLDPMDDAATFTVNGTGQCLAFTTDTYVVSPLFFPGGDIGKLAVHGTINDLSMEELNPYTSQSALFWRKVSPLLTCVKSSRRWRRPQQMLVSPSSREIRRWCSVAKPMACLSTPPAWALCAPPGRWGKPACNPAIECY